MTVDKVIRQVWRNKGNGQLLITLPKDKFKEGQYVEVKEVRSINDEKN